MRSTTWLLSGGGLANALLARRLLAKNQDFILIEKSPELFRGQTWSCQLSDVPLEDRDFLNSLASARWDRYSVRFPEYNREFESPYVTIRSEDLREKLMAEIPASRMLFNMGSAEGIHAQHIVHAKGFAATPAACGWQKFVGYDVIFENPHGLTAPVLMDADVEQTGGYRFFYLLPFDARRLLVEETHYSNGPEIRREEFAQGIAAYIAARFPGNPWSVEREEHGSLPIPWAAMAQAGRFGVAGGFFHPSTGYSLPQAVRTSRRLVEECGRGATVSVALAKISREENSNLDFYLMLNRMMFLASPPAERRRIFERFYKLGSQMIQRFYAGHPSPLDKVRMLTGRPPVKIIDAFKALSAEAPVWK